ncbi:MAG: SAF domain-containing protein [Actinomycetota bacterium]
MLTVVATSSSSRPSSLPPSSPRSPVPRRVRTPQWLDLRLVAGIALVLVSVVIGAEVVSSADSTQTMWAAARDLAPGSVLTAADLTPIRVRLPDGAGRYLSTRTALAGKTVNRQLSAGELLPRAALGATSAATTVTVPLDAAAAPTIERGRRIELWVTTKTCSAVPILDDVTVQDVQSGRGSAFASGVTQSVVIRVPAALAQRVITALALDGARVRAGILDGAPTADANSRLSPLDGCAAKK